MMKDNEFKVKDLEFVMEMLPELTCKLNEMNFSITGAAVCMILEEYAKANNGDVIELAEMLTEQIKEVVKTEGRY